MQKKVLIFGMGYTAAYFSELLLENNYQVFATTRNPENKLVKLKNNNFSLIDYHNRQEVCEKLQFCDAILITTPPSKDQNDPVLNDYGKEIIQFKNNIKWLAYLSTTGVYGNYDGNWVDEKSPCLATTNRTLNRIDIEKNYLELYIRNQIPVHIFRVAGIYGLGRSALDKLQSNNNISVYKPNHFFSRVHVKDIAQVLLASLKNPTPGEIYNLCDDLPAPSHEVDAYAAKLLKIPSPELIPFEQAKLSEMALEFYQANRKVSNKKLKEKLNYIFKYPNYKIGLEDIYHNSMTP